MSTTIAVVVFGVAILVALGFINDTLRRIEELLRARGTDK